MKQITLTQKDIEKAKIQNSPSGMLIDELAYSAGQWTSEDLYSNNYEYEPNEPYSFDYEADLFLKTKTHPELCNTAREIGYEGNLPSLQMCIKKGTTLQAGVFTALRLPEIWSALLEMYTNKLKEDRTDGISEAYNTQLQEEIDEYQEEQYREWLNGDRSNYAGVVKEIARYFTESGQGAYDRKEHEYTFTLDEQDIENMTDDGYKPSQGKKYLLDAIATASNARRSKDQIAREARKLERERLQAYKAEQARHEEEARKAKLLSMTIN